ncbi:MAG: hypothetical protein NXI16_14320 [Alphaproteobacteria bacterium]|nr:hypothetical protein [Alphaproteobacteria bacterium]
MSEAKPQTAREKIESLRATEFNFETKIFGVEGGAFKFDRNQEAAFYVVVGDLKAAITIPSLKTEFKISEDSHDGVLLDIVAESLKFVKEIRPGDSIPKEILDGSASWQVKDHHRAIAQGRVSVQIASWATGRETVIVDAEQLQMLADDPVTKGKVNEAFNDIAEKLTGKRENRQQIVDQVEQFGRELAYIEALRERYNEIRMVPLKLNELAKAYRRDRQTQDDINRIIALLRRPLKHFAEMFDQVDAQTGEIINVIRNAANYVEFIRETRDELHFAFMVWDRILPRWKRAKTDVGKKAESLIKDTYRFVAQEYPQQSTWTLVTKPSMQQAAEATSAEDDDDDDEDEEDEDY